MDTSNAFNSLNWQANIHQLCPSFSTVLINTYRSDVNLYIGDETLLSEEGTTQDDPLAMPMYALGTVPLINVLSDDHIKQVWCADDATACGSLLDLRRWWDRLVSIGSDFGYFPNTSKTCLIVKDSFYDSAVSIFRTPEFVSLLKVNDILELVWDPPPLLLPLLIRRFHYGSRNSLCYQRFQYRSWCC